MAELSDPLADLLLEYKGTKKRVDAYGPEVVKDHVTGGAHVRDVESDGCEDGAHELLEAEFAASAA